MAAPTWMTSSDITPPDPWVTLGTAHVGAGSANIIFQTTDSNDVNNWEYYQHLVLISIVASATSVNPTWFRVTLNDDTGTASSGTYPTGTGVIDRDYIHYHSGNYNGGANSVGNSNNTQYEYGTIGGTDGAGRGGASGVYWGGWVSYFMNINSTSTKQVFNYGGKFASVESGPLIGSTWWGGLINHVGIQGSNADNAKATQANGPITKIDLHLVDNSGTAVASQDFRGGSSFYLYGLHWDMT